jgi:hypothetical protein
MGEKDPIFLYSKIINNLVFEAFFHHEFCFPALHTEVETQFIVTLEKKEIPNSN